MHDGKMHGTLWKWTNYFSGWQPRWFVLEEGILSYYKSQEDVVNGCKGSIKMAVCDVHVHGTDMSRLDLIIPAEAHFYVRAASPQERQQWLVALGSAKACLTNGQPTSNSNSNLSLEMPEEQLKVKKSELRLYCDLLMQQVHSVKSAVTEDDTPSVEKLSEATTLLTATCDTFITTLEGCMKMANAHTAYDPSLSPDANMSPTKKSSISKTVPWSAGGLQRSISVDSSLRHSQSPEDDLVRGYIPPSLKVSTRGPRVRTSSRTISETSESSNDVALGNGITGGSKEPSPPPPGDDHGPPPSPSPSSGEVVTDTAAMSTVGMVTGSLGSVVEEEETIATFFTEMPANFASVDLKNETGIPTTQFLDACRPILPIFDKLNPTAFAPVKLDLAGNIKKIQQKLLSNPEKFDTLQRIVEHEVVNRDTNNPHCATLALLWLKRGLEFLREFLLEYLAGVDDLNLAANVAYAKTLKAYHSWVVRGVFALAVKAAPSKSDFLRHLSADTTDASLPSQSRVIHRHMTRYVREVDAVVSVIHEFYTTNGLDFPDQV